MAKVRIHRCEYCGTHMKGGPYRGCSFCGARPSWHHGRCCPSQPGRDDQGGQESQGLEETIQHGTASESQMPGSWNWLSQRSAEERRVLQMTGAEILASAAADRTREEAEARTADVSLQIATVQEAIVLTRAATERAREAVEAERQRSMNLRQQIQVVRRERERLENGLRADGEDGPQCPSLCYRCRENRCCLHGE